MDEHEFRSRYEPGLDDLLADDIMRLMLRSDGFDQERLHHLMVETRERIRLSRETDSNRD